LNHKENKRLNDTRDAAQCDGRVRFETHTIARGSVLQRKKLSRETTGEQAFARVEARCRAAISSMSTLPQQPDSRLFKLLFRAAPLEPVINHVTLVERIVGRP
jgi:hypothetical protein